MKHFGYIIVLFLLAGCTKQPYTISPEFISHMRQSNTIQYQMHRLDNLPSRRFLSELERDNERMHIAKRLNGEVALVVRDLVELNTTGFTPYIDELNQHNQNLAQSIEHFKVRQIPHQIERIITTCKACHSTFIGDSKERIK